MGGDGYFPIIRPRPGTYRAKPEVLAKRMAEKGIKNTYVLMQLVSASPNTVKKMTDGGYARPDTWRKVADVLGVTLYELLEDFPVTPSPNGRIRWEAEIPDREHLIKQAMEMRRLADEILRALGASPETSFVGARVGSLILTFEGPPADYERAWRNFKSIRLPSVRISGVRPVVVTRRMPFRFPTRRPTIAFSTQLVLSALLFVVAVIGLIIAFTVPEYSLVSAGGALIAALAAGGLRRVKSRGRTHAH